MAITVAPLAARIKRLGVTGAGLGSPRGGGLALAQEPGELAGLAVGVPERGRRLDQTLGAPECADHGNHDSAAQRGRLQMVVEPDLDVGPVALVGLVANGEVETADAVLAGMAQRLVQMRASRP